MAQYFNLTLDTTAPSGGILSGLQNYYNSNATVTISASGASFMKVWTNQTATGTTSDATYPSSWEPYNTSKTVSFSGQGTQYVHAQFMDEVGNISAVVNSSATIFDDVAPVISSVSINNGNGYARTADLNSITIYFSDATSGVATILLSGSTNDYTVTPYTLTDNDRTAGHVTLTIDFTGSDGNKTIAATVTDRAGNTSSSVSDTIVLDTTPATIVASLRDASDTNNLASYVKTRDYGVRIVTEATDITHYKVWEGDTEPSSWTAISSATEVSGVGYFVDNLQLSTGDGTKTIHVKVQDTSGNITTSPNLTVVLDTIVPVVRLTSDVSVISGESGYNTITFSYNATDTNSSAGFNNVVLKASSQSAAEGSIIKSASYNNDISITHSELMEFSRGNIYYFHLQLQDAAGNLGDSNMVVVTVDTSAPTGSITVNPYYTNGSYVTFSLSASDTGGAGLASPNSAKVWLDNNSEPSSYNYVANSTATITGTISEGAHVLHVRFKDKVGNESIVYDSSQFIVDSTAPTGTISTSQYTNNRTINISLNALDIKTGVDTTSGVGYMKVWEDGQSQPTEWENYAVTKSITLAEGSDGIRTIKALFKDNAGNAMTTPVTCTTTLDLDEPDAVLNLLKTDGNGLPAKVNYRNFKAKISHTAPDTSPIVQYKLSGDFDQSSSDWQVFEYDSGQTYMTISNLTFTTGDELKTVTLQLKDAAGNVSSAVNVTVTYDTSPPVIDVNAPDYNVVSKEHTIRLNASGTEVNGKYNDMCIFTWSANENLAAFKVCVNEVGQTAASAVAIGTEYGSLNMSGSAISANTDVTSTIFGADFAATDAVNDTDGAYEIIVYGQDEGGTWSAVHVLS